jgi:molybdenum cofactor biosynthesis enzyme MoaA
MSNSKIFCNVPWTNAHIYWDGSLGTCCSEQHRPYRDDLKDEYNLSKMTVIEWYNSKPMKEIRNNITGDKELSICKRCYYEESIGYESRRIKENFKSVIFTKQAFDKSYIQSPWIDKFEAPDRDQSPPIDWHVDLGNECNLSCKMCNPNASSQIASKYTTWGLPFERRKNWTNDDTSWNNFLISVDNSNINRLHLMGGEPMLSKRFKQLVDYLIDTNRTGISISFVTNGTILDQEFIDKLKKFRSFDLEISIESLHKNNHYIRQGMGSITDLVKENIEKLAAQQTETFKVILRSVPQLLNVNNYHEYILWAWEQKLAVQGIPLARPAYLSINVLPESIRKSFIDNYENTKSIIQQQSTRSISTLTTGRDTSRLDIQLIAECNSIIHLLKESEPIDIETQRKELANWLIKWDKSFDLNAYDYYPEYSEFLQSIGYEV